MAALVAVCVALRAVDIPGGEYEPGYPQNPPLPSATIGTPEALLRVHDDVFDPLFLKQLQREAAVFEQLAEETGNLPLHKRVTFWMPIRDSCDEPFWHDGKKNAPGCRMREPRSAAEQAVLLLADTLFNDNPDIDRSSIVGGKYWVQRRGPNNDVGFHYDKDEAFASLHMRMKFPYYSTVTYLTDWGAPTVIFNQTVMHNGNDVFPLEPDEGWLVYPKQNRHMINRGDLHHGAVDVLTAKPVPPGRDRLTFVVTWWKEKPLEPNCHDLTDAEWPQSLRDGATAFRKANPEAWARLGPRGQVQPAVIDMGAGTDAGGNLMQPADVRRVSLPLGRAGKRQHFELPSQVSGNDPLFLRWNLSQASQAVVDLDLEDEKVMNMVWESDTPVAIVFGAGPASEGTTSAAVGSGASANRVADLFAATQLASRQFYQQHNVQFDPAPALKDRILVLTAGTEAADAMEAFGIMPDAAKWNTGAEDGLPAAVMHMTKSDVRYRAGPKYHPLTASNLVAFWNDVVAGKVDPLPSDDDSEDGNDEL